MQKKDEKKEKLFKTPVGGRVVDFLNYIEIERGRSLKTRENYEHYLTVFLEHTGISKPSEITDSLVTSFRLWLNRQATGNNKFSGETLSRKTQNYYLIALRSFLKYLARVGVSSLSPERIELAKVSERSLDLITSADLALLLDAPRKVSQNSYSTAKEKSGKVSPAEQKEKENQKLRTLRDSALLELLFSTGLRVSELCSLTRDIDLRSDELSIRGKGGKVRVVFLSEAAKRKVKEYLDSRRDMEEALFVKIGKEHLMVSKKTVDSSTVRRGGEEVPSALSDRSVQRLVKFYATKAGLSKKVTPHTLRHVFATDLLSNGADLRSVQALLGHSNISTTQVYTHVTDKHLRDIHKKFHSRT